MENSGILLALLLFCLYFVPGIVAEHRAHHNKFAIGVLNIFSAGRSLAGPRTRLGVYKQHGFLDRS